eukprot:TRINITY_DN22359_c0_g1_i1.p1 TRINITY_DN22359_c0_g1~~TRINITY_DN22359_c0_g1_i1.p1  ORF type:complete len:138 (+),score=20.65 TRINITY_DN22359_c0_g1_i1:125-538(+)
MKGFLLCVLLFIIAFFQSSESRSVTGLLRNGFQNDVTLVKSHLDQGEWVTPPASDVPVSNQYTPIFEVRGSGKTNSTSGWVSYTSDNGYTSVTLYFVNTAINSTYWINVAPSPWIGGMGNINGKIDVSADYWLHEMC